MFLRSPEAGLGELLKHVAQEHGPAGVRALRALPARVILATYYAVKPPAADEQPSRVEALHRINHAGGAKGRPPAAPSWLWKPPAAPAWESRHANPHPAPPRA